MIRRTPAESTERSDGMATKYREGGKKTNLWVWIITGLFAAVGIALLIITNFTNIVKWLRVFGVTMIAVSAPILAKLLFELIKDKIRKM